MTPEKQGNHFYWDSLKIIVKDNLCIFVARTAALDKSYQFTSFDPARKCAKIVMCATDPNFTLEKLG